MTTEKVEFLGTEFFMSNLITILNYLIYKKSKIRGFCWGGGSSSTNSQLKSKRLVLRKLKRILKDYVYREISFFM